MSNDIQIRQIDQNNAEQALSLFNSVFRLNADIDFWLRKHYSSPFGESLFWGAFCENDLVAMNGFMPVQFTKDNTIYYALESCESATRPDFRHKGLFSMIVREAEKWAQTNGYDFLFGLPNMYSYPGFLKLGWKKAGEANSFGRISRIRKWNKEKNRPIANSLQIMNFLRNKLLPVSSKEYEIIEINCKEFSSMINKDDHLHCCFTEEYLEWKKQYKKISLYKVLSRGKTSLALAADNDSILYLRFSDNNSLNNCKYLMFACYKLFFDIPFINICADERIIDKKCISRAGFITRREPPYPRIVKGLSERAKDVSFFNDLIIQAIEED